MIFDNHLPLETIIGKLTDEFPIQIPNLLFISRPHNCVLSASRGLGVFLSSAKAYHAKNGPSMVQKEKERTGKKKKIPENLKQFQVLP